MHYAKPKRLQYYNKYQDCGNFLLLKHVTSQTQLFHRFFKFGYSFFTYRAL